MIAFVKDPTSPAKAQDRAMDQQFDMLVRELRETRPDMDGEQRDIAEDMIRRLLKDVADGHHPIIGELLKDQEQSREVVESLVSAISRQVMGLDRDDVTTTLQHQLSESDANQVSAIETPAEELERKMRSMDSGLQNYFKLEAIEKKEQKGEEPQGSAIMFLKRLHQTQSNMRIPGTFERNRVREWIGKASDMAHNIADRIFHHQH